MVKCYTFMLDKCTMYGEKKKEIWLGPLKAPTPVEMSKGQSDNANHATKKFDYTAVADRHRTVNWSNYGQPTGVVDQFYGAHLPTTLSCVIEDTKLQMLLYSDINFAYIYHLKAFKVFQVVKLRLPESEKIAFQFNRNVFENCSARLYDGSGTDWGRSIEWQQTPPIRLVLLTDLRNQPSHYPQQPCNQKDTH